MNLSKSAPPSESADKLRFIKDRIHNHMDLLAIRSKRPAHEEDGFVAADFSFVHANYDLNQIQFSSQRKLLGAVIVLAKRILRRLLIPIISRQIGINAAQARISSFLKERVEVLQARAKDLEVQVSQKMDEMEERFGTEISDVQERLATHSAFLQLDKGVSVEAEVLAPPNPSSSIFQSSNSAARWFPPAALGPSTIARYASTEKCLSEVIALLERMEQDDVMRSMLSYYEFGRARFGPSWCYADITTVLMACAKLMRPSAYLEIGVFHGRSMSMVASVCPDCEIVGFDLWVPDYAGLSNPGPELIRRQLSGLGYRGDLTLISGNSHETLPRYFDQNPGKTFDLITVDGDHTYDGAAEDLEDVIPHLRAGGVLVFDDIAYPGAEYLYELWAKKIASDRRFVAWDFRELGNGVAVAVKKT